jgi:hypothetical protein
LSGAFQVERTNFLSNVLRAYHGNPKPIRIHCSLILLNRAKGEGKIRGRAELEFHAPTRAQEVRGCAFQGI